jgi:hypothetical protein
MRFYRFCENKKKILAKTYPVRVKISLELAIPLL